MVQAVVARKRGGQTLFFRALFRTRTGLRATPHSVPKYTHTPFSCPPHGVMNLLCVAWCKRAFKFKTCSHIPLYGECGVQEWCCEEAMWLTHRRRPWITKKHAQRESAALLTPPTAPPGPHWPLATGANQNVCHLRKPKNHNCVPVARRFAHTGTMFCSAHW